MSPNDPKSYFELIDLFLGLFGGAGLSFLIKINWNKEDNSVRYYVVKFLPDWFGVDNSSRSDNPPKQEVFDKDDQSDPLNPTQTQIVDFYNEITETYFTSQKNIRKDYIHVVNRDNEYGIKNSAEEYLSIHRSMNSNLKRIAERYGFIATHGSHETNCNKLERSLETETDEDEIKRLVKDCEDSMKSLLNKLKYESD